MWSQLAFYTFVAALLGAGVALYFSNFWLLLGGALLIGLVSPLCVAALVLERR